MLYFILLYIYLNNLLILIKFKSLHYYSYSITVKNIKNIILFIYLANYILTLYTVLQFSFLIYSKFNSYFKNISSFTLLNVYNIIHN